MLAILIQFGYRFTQPSATVMLILLVVTTTTMTMEDSGVLTVPGENALCNIGDNNELICDNMKHKYFLPFFTQRNFLHLKIERLLLRCSLDDPSLSLETFVLANNNEEFLKYSSDEAIASSSPSSKTNGELRELRIVDCEIKERFLTQIIDILYNSDRKHIKVLNITVSRPELKAVAMSEVGHFFNGNSELLKSIHVIDLSGLILYKGSKSLSFEKLKHLKKLRMANVEVVNHNRSINNNNNRNLFIIGGSGGTNSLVELIVRNNSMVKTNDCSWLQQNFTNLEQLDLSRNEMKIDKAESCFRLAHLSKLKVLQLSYNKIALKGLSGRLLFANLPNLEMVTLDYNGIEDIEEGVFNSNMTKLVVLTLTGNKLSSLDELAFRHLVALRQLDLDNNRLARYPSPILGKANQLVDLNLNGNQFVELPLGIENSFPKLKSLDLGGNRLKTINGKQFFGLNELLGLRLVDNQITRITKSSFYLLNGLQIINLSSNRINFVEIDSFQLNLQLQIVRLDRNQLNMLPKNCFKSLPMLLWLNISSNSLSKFYLNELPTSLELLDLHFNKIYEMRNLRGADYLTNLKFLDVSHNHLPLLSEEVIPNSLVEMNLENNFITFIELNAFTNKNKLVKINLRNNFLTRIESKLFFHKINFNHELELRLSKNPFDCDCSLEWLLILQQNANPNNLRILDIEEIACTSPIQRKRLLKSNEMGKKDADFQSDFHTPVLNSTKLKTNVIQLIDSSNLIINEKQFLCKYERHCFTLCQCCDFESCECFMKCPDNCNCYYETTWQTNIVDCGRQNLTTVPIRLPSDMTTIYLDGNHFNQIQQNPFLSHQKLTVLFLNHSLIEVVTNSTFHGLVSLRELHLENNQIRELIGNEFSYILHINRLYLHNNRLNSINSMTFKDLKELNLLTLSHNDFHKIEPFKFLLSTPLSTFIVSGILTDLHVLNHFDCDFNCNEMEEAFQLHSIATNSSSNRQTLLRKFFKNRRINELECFKEGEGEKATLVIRRFIEKCEFVIEANHLRLVNKTVLSHPSIDENFRKYVNQNYSLIGNEYLPWFAITVTSVLLLMFVVILIVAFRRHILLYLFTKCSVRLSLESGMSSDKYSRNISQNHATNGLSPVIYDAHLFCNERDFDYINHFVVDEMKSMGYLTFLTSDWDGQLNISLDISRKLILVVSSGFIQMEWQNVAFRQALYSILGRLENEGHDRISGRVMAIVAVPVELLISDVQLLKFLKSTTVLYLGEKRFWDKLRFALPDISSNEARRGIIVNRQNGADEKESIEQEENLDEHQIGMNLHNHKSDRILPTRGNFAPNSQIFSGLSGSENDETPPPSTQQKILLLHQASSSNSGTNQQAYFV